MNSMCEILFTIMTPAVHVRDVPELNKQLESGVGPKKQPTPGVLKIFQVNRSLKFIPNFPAFHLKSPTKPQNIHNFWEQFCKYLVEE